MPVVEYIIKMQCFTASCKDRPPINLTVSHTDTIESLKAKLAEAAEGEPYDFSIIRNGKRLDDEPYRRVLEWGSDVSGAQWGYLLKTLGGGILF